MATYIVWLDSEKAHLFDLTVSGVEKSHLKRKEIDHHTFNKKDHHGDPATLRFYRDLADMLKDAEELLLLGPGQSKEHFKSFLDTHYPSGLAQKVVGIEKTDHPTDNQILEVGRTFFRTYNLFNHPVRELARP